MSGFSLLEGKQPSFLNSNEEEVRGTPCLPLPYSARTVEDGNTAYNVTASGESYGASSFKLWSSELLDVESAPHTGHGTESVHSWTEARTLQSMSCIARVSVRDDRRER